MADRQPLLSGSSGPARPSGAPVDATTRRKVSERVIQSSLDIVFSYSRSQQLYFGNNLTNVPSFVEGSAFPGMTPVSVSQARRDRRRRRRRQAGQTDEDGDLEAGAQGDDTETGTGTEDDSQFSEADEDGDDDERNAELSAYIDDEETSASRRPSRPQSRRPSDSQGRTERRLPYLGAPPAMVFNHDHSPSPSRGGSPSPSPSRRKSATSARGDIAPMVMSSLARPPIRTYGSTTGPAQRPIVSSSIFSNPVPFAPRSPALRRDATPADDTFDDEDASCISALATPASTHAEPLRKRSMVSVSLGPTPRSGRRASWALGAEGEPQDSGWSAVQGVGRQPRRRSSVISRRSLAAGVELGRSTNGQTLFNAIAVLVGIGVLSEPLAFAYAGWIGGTLLLIFFGVFTNYTAKLLAKIILADPNCRGYSDLGVKAFGWKARLFVDVLFCLELFALSIAWIVLFGDSLAAVLPGGLSSNTYKVIGFFMVAPTTLLPLHLLSIPSIMSLVSSLVVIIILLVDGFGKTTAPGSITHPVPTSWGPDWTGGNVLGGLGLLIAGFGGHAIIPSLAIDMKEPKKFDKMINIAYLVASVVFFIAGAAGYLMFGDRVSDEITKDLLLEKYGFSKVLNQIATWMIVINPITKFALCTRPLNLTVETIFSLNPSPPPPTSGKAAVPDQDLDSQFTIRTTSAFPAQPIPASAPESYRRAEHRKTAWRIVARGAVTAACVIVAVALPGFGRLMAFLGSFTTFFICVILPLMFYTALTPREERGRTRDIIHGILFAVCVVMMLAGTAWAIVTGDREPEGW